MKNDSLAKLCNSLEEQVSIYEDKKKRSWEKFSNISFIENMAYEYVNLKKQTGIVDILSISILTFLIFKCGFSDVNKVMLISLFASIGSFSVFNIYKFTRIKKIKNTFKNVDFDNFDFEKCSKIKALYIEECMKIDEYIMSLNRQIDTVNKKIDSTYVYDNEFSCEKVLVKKIGGKK